MTSKLFNPRKPRRVASTRCALRQALNEMGFGRESERPEVGPTQPGAALAAAAWRSMALDLHADDEPAGSKE